jgi:hypothetical protein
VRKILAFEQQRFVHFFRQGVGKAVAEVQFRRVAACFSEITERFPRNAGLTLSS